MSVFQRTDGRWVVKYKDNLGKRIQKTFKEEGDARKFSDELYIDSREGSRITVFEAVTLYIKDHDWLSGGAKRQYAWTVAGSVTKAGKRIVGCAECIADKFVDELTRRDFNDVRDNLRARGNCNGTINNYISMLNSSFNYAASEGLIKDNPWKAFSNLRHRKKRRDGSLEDFRKLYAILPEWMQWWCRTCMALCLRPGAAELFGLQWKAFDWVNNAVTVYMGKVGRSKTVYPIREYMDEARARFEQDEEGREGYVCRNKYGRQVKYYKTTWHRFCRQAGVSIPPYAMRHLAATLMLAAGADVASVAANLGHSTPAVTLKVYAHAMPAGQRDASIRMGAAWCENGDKKSIKSIG